MLGCPWWCLVVLFVFYSVLNWVNLWSKANCQCLVRVGQVTDGKIHNGEWRSTDGRSQMCLERKKATNKKEGLGVTLRALVSAFGG
jgi:hypothetical protein